MQDRIDHRPPPGSPEREAFLEALADEVARCADRMALLARLAEAAGETRVAARLGRLAGQVRGWRWG